MFLKMKQGNKGLSCNAGICRGRSPRCQKEGGKCSAPKRMRQLCLMSCALNMTVFKENQKPCVIFEFQWSTLPLFNHVLIFLSDPSLSSEKSGIFFKKSNNEFPFQLLLSTSNLWETIGALCSSTFCG